MVAIWPVHKAIFTLIKNACSAVGYDAYDGRIPITEETDLLSGDGVTIYQKAHAVLYLGNDRDSPVGRAITGTNYSIGVLEFAVLCVGNSNPETTYVRDVVNTALQGVRPVAGCGEIQRAGGLAIPPSSSVLQPDKFFRTIGYWVNLND